MLKLPAVLTLAALFAGCTPMASLHPLVSADDGALVDSAYTGLWKSCDDNDLWKIEASGDRAYSYRQLDKDSDKGQFRLIELGGQWFADVQPEGGIVTGHLLAKVRLDGDTLYLAFLTEAAAVKALPHEIVGSGDNRQVILTAGTPSLRKFLMTVRHQPDAFAKEDSLCRLK
jgi:hypothetical protein